MSRKLVTGALTIAFLPLGTITSAVTMGFLLTAFTIVSPILVVWLAFYVASLAVNKLAETFQKPSLKFEGFTAFTLDAIKRIAICALVSIPLLPLSLIVVGLIVAVIAPLLFVLLAGFFSYVGAKQVISFFAGEESNNRTDSEITYIPIPAHQIHQETHDAPRPNSATAPYQSSIRRFFDNPVESAKELYGSYVSKPHQG
ncbi:hypothetical protein Lnau_1471 [Legionella nautarum]|uniref:Transmembrane protein n=1 Tax=Legionella nautarum TaxID=45070 RepID=A0A0W0WVZ4_9GAMM|nr:EI24 domain-containing protein [Legionella nautarum]KTD36487.1 hypothetical protein Lnau_1471 [Legionella nautarum]